MTSTSIQVKKQKIMEDNCDQNGVNFMLTGKTEYSYRVTNFLEKVQTGPNYVCVMCNCYLYYSNAIKFDSEKYDRIHRQVKYQCNKF